MVLESLTPPKTNEYPLKINGSDVFPIEFSPFLGDEFVRFRVMSVIEPQFLGLPNPSIFRLNIPMLGMGDLPPEK